MATPRIYKYLHTHTRSLAHIDIHAQILSKCQTSIFLTCKYVKQRLIWPWMIPKEMMMQSLVFYALSVMWILKSQCSATTWRKNTALTSKMQYVLLFNL